MSFDPKWTPADVIERAGQARPGNRRDDRRRSRGASTRDAERGDGDGRNRGAGHAISRSSDPPRRRRFPSRAAGERSSPPRSCGSSTGTSTCAATELQKNLILRHRLQQTTRRFLDERGFLEIETPILTKPTPEGARDYLVPSRVHPGEFYALPQSPQLYKQLLMIAGLRPLLPDRALLPRRGSARRPAARVHADRHRGVVHRAARTSTRSPRDCSARSVEGRRVTTSRRRSSGCATPTRWSGSDSIVRILRYALELFDASDAFRGSEFGVTNAALAAGGRVRGFRIPGGATLSRKQVDEIEAIAKSAGAGGLIRLKRGTGGLEGPAAKFLSESGAQRLGDRRGGARVCWLPGAEHISNPGAGSRAPGRRAAAVAGSGGQTIVPLGHRFSDVHSRAERHAQLGAPSLHGAQPGGSRAARHARPRRFARSPTTWCLNGLELGGGSIRINDPATAAEGAVAARDRREDGAEHASASCSNALSAGAPPHGGIAFGFDRLAMVLAGASSLRDVIAFPKTTAARALFEDAPSAVPPEDLRDLHLQTMTSLT